MSFGKSMNLNHGAGILLTIALFAFGTRASLGAPAFESAQPTQKAVSAGTPTLPADVQHIADWAVHSGDHKGLPFIIVDKVNAMAVAFDNKGRRLRSTPVLVGMGVGDKFEPGVAEMEMHLTKPSQRITPAGRYVAEEGVNLAHERVLWVDYDSGIALHKIPAKPTKQRRHERMRSANAADHRITYGCINVPPAFYDQVVRPHFSAKGGVVYVLPDSLPLKAVFKSYDVGVGRVSSAEQAGSAQTPSSTQRF
jgi:L,D-transpeptidase catalytic domain